MTEIEATAYAPSDVSPPGETLREILEERGIPQAELALRMGRPRKTISEVISGKAALTHETALQLELVLGVPASFWDARERTYRAHLAAVEENRRLEKEAAWCGKFPVKQMVDLGYIKRPETKAGRVRELFSYFGVASSKQWYELYSDRAIAFRTSAKFEMDPFALGAWLRYGLRESQGVEAAAFDREKFEAALVAARSLTRKGPEKFVPALRDWCAPAGVVVLFVPELPKSRASGATRWVTPDKALIQLSLRYRTNDHLWFTFFHEAAHILLHGKRLIFIEANGSNGAEEEAQANAWAADWLIPPAEYARFTAQRHFSDSAIRKFARQIDIAPGIVVGRLQHDGLIKHSQLNHLKVRLGWRAPTAEPSPAASKP